MNKLTAALVFIQQSAASLLTESPLLRHDQHRTFIKHIQQTAGQLIAITSEIPDSELALALIVPALGEKLSQPLVALYGYARLLLEYPESFGGVQIPDALSSILRAIYDEGMALARLTDDLNQQHFAKRVAGRTQSKRAFNLASALKNHLPIFRYWIRDRAVRLNAYIAPDLPCVSGYEYHTAEFIRHVIQTMAYELVEYGEIALSLTREGDGPVIAVRIFCTGIRMTDEDYQTLFGKNGRELYLQHMNRQGAKIQLERRPGMGAGIVLMLPLSTGDNPEISL